MKTVIIGNSGSGKSWLANQMAKRTSAPVVHFDEIFWLPGGFDKKRSDHDVSEIVADHLVKNTWIAEGVFGALAAVFLAHADELIWLLPSQDICVSRLQVRGSESKRHMNRNQSASGLLQLIAWAQTYETRTGSSSASAHQHLYEGFTKHKEKLFTTDDVGRYLNAKMVSGAVTLKSI